MSTGLMIFIFIKTIVGCILCTIASIVIGYDFAGHNLPFIEPEGSRFDRFKIRMVNALRIFCTVAYPYFVFKVLKRKLSTAGAIIGAIFSLIFLPEAVIFIIFWGVPIIIYNIFMLCFERIYSVR